MATTLAKIMQTNEMPLANLQAHLGYQFSDLKLLQIALIHSSFAFEQLETPSHNETQEFLGDAVLDLAVGTILFRKFPKMREGKLTKLRAALVNEAGLAGLAEQLALGEHLMLGRGEEAGGGRDKASILSCAFEAVIGGVFLDGGYEVTQTLVYRLIESRLSNHQNLLLMSDAKTGLQEHVQNQYGEAPVYTLEAEEGPPHDRRFTISVQFQGAAQGQGTGPSKKEAAQQAATQALDRLAQHAAKQDSMPE